MTTSPTWLDNWMAVGPTPEAILLNKDPSENPTREPLDLSHIAASDRWAYRLQQLATQGFASWLQEREPSLACSRFDSQAALAAPLQVGEFKVCLIPTSLSEDEIAIPQAAIEQAERRAHFYVGIAVDEEAEVASLVGFLPYNELTALCTSISPDADQTYPLPTAQLTADVNALLLFLQCLSPSALPLSETSTSPARPSIVETLGQSIANARTWLDSVLPNDGWQAGWQPSLAMGMRWDTASLDNPLNQVLQFHNVPNLPAEAGKAFQSITLAGRTLRLFGAAWSLSKTDGEWMLLTILCPAPGEAFPPGLSLAIDEITPGRPRVELVRETFVADQPRAALFAQVKGDRDDVFDITLTISGSQHQWSTAVQFQPEA